MYIDSFDGTRYTDDIYQRTKKKRQERKSRKMSGQRPDFEKARRGSDEEDPDIGGIGGGGAELKT